ncbi:MAG: hypothetical protein M3Y64_03805 [Gemmatimonadota bacterium]|nr:hypothetical protein [Gemmatimonadota bacterium]
MSDIETSLPEWAVCELHKPVRTSAEQRDRIMELVRVQPRPRRRASAAFHPRWFRRGVLSSSGAAIAAMMTALLTIVGYPHSSGVTTAPWAEATVIGDTVVSEGVTTRFAHAIADTLRIVRFALRAPNATRVALSGDFNSWNHTSTWLTFDKKSGVWTARVAVPRNATRYAFVVDGDRWMGAPTPMRAATAGGLIYADSI